MRALPRVCPIRFGESCVPITWTIDAVVVAGSMPYRKLFGGTSAESKLIGEEMMLLVARIRAYHTLFGVAAAGRPSKIFRAVGAGRHRLDARPA